MTKDKDKEFKTLQKALSASLREVFGEHQKTQRFVDVTRIPLLCKSILETSERLKTLNENMEKNFVRRETFEPIQKVVYGMVTLILLGVGAAILTVTLK